MGIMFAAFNLLHEKMEAGQTPVIMTLFSECVYSWSPLEGQVLLTRASASSSV